MVERILLITTFMKVYFLVLALLIMMGRSLLFAGEGPKEKIYYFHRDRLGSIIAISDSKGEIRQRYRYNSFGEVVALKGQGQPVEVDNPLLFTGRRYDKETGLYYYRNRYYSPERGRFITRDPLGYIDGPNVYSYVSNNPLNGTDPQGTYGESVHRYLTAFLARKAGFSNETARSVGNHDQWVDDDEDRNPVMNGIIDQVCSLSLLDLCSSGPGPTVAEWHFAREDGKPVIPGSEVAAEKWKQAARNGDLKGFGEGLHVYQDSWSHQGMPSLQGSEGSRYGHPFSRGGPLSSDADKTHKYPRDAFAMSRHVYNAMLSFLKKNPYHKKTKAKSFDSIAETVWRFILEDDEDRQEQILREAW